MLWAWGNCKDRDCQCRTRTAMELVLQLSVRDVRWVFQESAYNLVSGVSPFCYWVLPFFSLLSSGSFHIVLSYLGLTLKRRSSMPVSFIMLLTYLDFRLLLYWCLIRVLDFFLKICCAIRVCGWIRIMGLSGFVLVLHKQEKNVLVWWFPILPCPNVTN